MGAEHCLEFLQGYTSSTTGIKKVEEIVQISDTGASWAVSQENLARRHEFESSQWAGTYGQVLEAS
jgi:hypothetical protein